MPDEVYIMFVGALIIFISMALGFTAIKFSSDIVIDTAEDAMLEYASEVAEHITGQIDVRLAILNELSLRNSTISMLWETQEESLIE